MTSWQDAERQAKEQEARANAGGLFVSLKDDGDKVRVVIVGEPELRKVYWDGTTTKDWTPDCGEKPKTKWLLNAFDVDQKKMMILECGGQLFRQIVNVKEKFPLNEWVFEVKRSGRARDTKTTYSILPDKQLDPAQRAYIAKLDPHDLIAFTGGNGAAAHISSPGNGTAKKEAEERAAAQAAEFSDDDVPF